MTARVDDRDCEFCPDCGFAPGYQNSCGCWDDGSGSLGSEFRSFRQLSTESLVMTYKRVQSSCPILSSAQLTHRSHYREGTPGSGVA